MTQTSSARGAPLSITLRLGLLYAASSYVMLVVATAFLYGILVQGIERDDLHFVLDKVRRLEWILLQQPDKPGLLEYEVKWDGGPRDTDKHYAFYTRILDEQGRLVVETRDMATIAPVGSFAPPVDSERASNIQVVQHWHSPQGQTYCALSVRTRDSQNTRSWVIQVAMDDSEEEQLLERLQHGSLIVLLVGTVMCAGIGTIAARRGMRPLSQIAASAERITANQLGERLDPAHWPAELGALALALNGMLGRLEGSFARISQCAADLAHELRTPIHNLIGEAQVALSTDRTPAEYREILESSLEEFDRLARMTNEMLFLARAEDPQKLVERVPLEARTELDAVVEFFDALSEAHGVTVACEGQGRIDVEPLLFRRAVTNLLSNALRHTPAGGRIVVSVAPADGNATVVKVSDTGCGIQPEHLPSICDRKKCASRDTGRCSGEHGLGLSIVKSIVELHGGSIAVESALEKGTTVAMRFPAAAPRSG